MVRRRTGGSGGPIGQRSFLAPPPPAPRPRRSTDDGGVHPACRYPAGRAFHAVSFGGDRREAAQRLAEAEALFVARYGTPARLIAVPADEYDEYVRLARA